MTLTDPSAPAKRSRPRGAKVLMILGGVLLVVGVVGAQWGIDRVQDTADEISNSGDEVRNGLLIQLPVPGDAEVDLEVGRYDIFALAATGTGFSRTTTTTTSPVVTDATATTDPDPAEVDEPVVTVTGPDGRPVTTRDPGIESLFSGAAGELYAIESFTATDAGTYRISATGTGAEKVGVGPTVDTGNVGRIVSGGLFTLLAFLGGGLGAILGLAGLIWFLVAGDGSPKPGPAGLFPPGPPAGPYGGPAGWSPPPPGPGQGGWAPPGQWAPPGGSPPQPGPPGWSPAPARPPDPEARRGTGPEAPAGPVAGGSAPPPSGPTGPAPPSPRPAPWGDAPPEADGPSR